MSETVIWSYNLKACLQREQPKEAAVHLNISLLFTCWGKYWIWKFFLDVFVCVVPEEFMYNPVSRSYGEPHKRPEVQNATIEFIAPSEYMVGLVFLILINVSTKYVVVCDSTF